MLQEIGREINTTGSKAYDADIQKCVVNMKDELEKAKEQVLNVLIASFRRNSILTLIQKKQFFINKTKFTGIPFNSTFFCRYIFVLPGTWTCLKKTRRYSGKI